MLAKSFNLVCQGQDKTICFCFSPTLPTAAGLYPLKRNYRMEQAAECSIPWASHGPQSLLNACQRRFKSRGDEKPSPRWRQWEALGEGQETQRHRLTVETAARRFLLLSPLTQPFFFLNSKLKPYRRNVTDFETQRKPWPAPGRALHERRQQFGGEAACWSRCEQEQEQEQSYVTRSGAGARWRPWTRLQHSSSPQTWWQSRVPVC